MVNRTRCCVPNCNDQQSTKRTLPVFDEEIYTIWVQRIGNPALRECDPKIVLTRYRVCDSHFSDYCRTKGQKKLKLGSLPTLHLPGFSGPPSYENSIYKHSNNNVPFNKNGETDAFQHNYNVDDLIRKVLECESLSKHLERELELDRVAGEANPTAKEVEIEPKCKPKARVKTTKRRRDEICQVQNLESDLARNPWLQNDFETKFYKDITDEISLFDLVDDSLFPIYDDCDKITLEKLALEEINEIQYFGTATPPSWEPGNFDETFFDVNPEEVTGVFDPDMTSVPEPVYTNLISMKIF